MAVKESENQGQEHENSTQPDGSFGENIGRLGAKDRIGEVPAEGGTQSLRTGFLHEDKQGE